MKPDALTTATSVFEISSPTTNARRMTTPVTPVTPATPARSNACDPVSAPTPWIMPTPNAVLGPYCVECADGVCSWPWMRACTRSHASRARSKTSIQRLRGFVTVRRDRRAGGDVDLGVPGGRRAGDVGDRRDVVPVEAMAEAERDHAEEHAEKAEIHQTRRLASVRGYRNQPQ